MLTTLALAALTAAPAQPPGGLQLNNVRITVGELGPVRPTSKLLPGDILFVGYDIDGITIDGDGFARYTIAMTVLDKDKKPFFKQDPRDLADLVPLRGNRIPARAFITIGLDTEPGPYSCQVTVTDKQSKASQTLTVPFEVLKKDFGIVAVLPTSDPRGEISAPTTGTVGQSIFVWHSIAGFARDPKTKQPSVELEYQVHDEAGKPVLEKPRKQIQDDKSPTLVDQDKGAFVVPPFPVFLNRPGKFVVKMTARDRVANKTASYDLPITVLAGN